MCEFIAYKGIHGIKSTMRQLEAMLFFAQVLVYGKKVDWKDPR
jgi:hypothetical protein